MPVKKAEGIFVELYSLWKNKNILIKTKIYVFNSNMESILLYECKTRKMTIQIRNKF